MMSINSSESGYVSDLRSGNYEFQRFETEPKSNPGGYVRAFLDGRDIMVHVQNDADLDYTVNLRMMHPTEKCAPNPEDVVKVHSSSYPIQDDKLVSMYSDETWEENFWESF